MVGGHVRSIGKDKKYKQSGNTRDHWLLVIILSGVPMWYFYLINFV